MRSDTTNFIVKNSSVSKDPRYVVEIAFDSANIDLYYFTSHSDAALPGAALSVSGVIKGLSGTSQAVSPEKALATIGTLSFQVVDNANTVTMLQYNKLQLGKSLRGMRVRVYIGYEGLDWADYSLVTTQIIEDVEYNEAAYNFRCSDVQREERKDIFDLATTNLSSTLSIGDTVVNVYDTSSFESVAHSNSYSDAPSQTVYYFKIKDEIIRATGKTATTFTGCTRGVLNTKEALHEIDTSASAERRTEVSEYIYLELPAPKLAYAILTGKLIGQSPDTLPTSWHLGIPETYVRLSDFTGILEDLFDTTNDSLGFVLRFEGLKKQDGKKFIEQELLLPMGCFSPVYSDGQLGLKRMVSVLSQSGYVYQLDQHNVASHSSLLHDMKSLHNHIEIKWNWLDSKEKYTRRNVLIDDDSIAVHGLATPLKFSFRGLNGSRHSTETLGERFDSFRDRYTGPPLRISVTCLPSTNILEVGDTVRLSLPNVKDYNTGLELDRTFEIQNVSIDWITGKVTFALFGSSQAASAIAQVAVDNVVPDAWYTSEGNNLATLIQTGYDYTTNYTDISSVGHIDANCTLTGGTDLKNASTSIYYHDGDLVIDAGVVLSITNNVQLRVKGFLTINGEINGAGAGNVGAAYRSSDRTPATTTSTYKYENHTKGISGFIGNPQSGGGVIGENYQPYKSHQGHTTFGQYPVTPKLSFSIIGSTVEGIPANLLGSSGATGRVYTFGQNFGGVGYWVTGAGGAGGNGGAGLFMTSRGAAFGASGLIDISGTDGFEGDRWGAGPNESVWTTNTVSQWAGSGAGGAPGAVYFAIDGVSSTIPLLDKVTACYGNTPIKQIPVTAPELTGVIPVPRYSYYLGTQCSNSDLSGYNGAARISFVVGAETPEEDPGAQIIQPPTGLTLASGTNELFVTGDGTVVARIKASWTAADDSRVVGYEVQYKKSADSVWINVADVIGEVESWIQPIDSGIAYDVRVRSSDNIRNTSGWVTEISYTALGKTDVPSNVTGFNAYNNGITIVFKWSQVPDIDLAGYEIRYITQGAANTWGDGIKLTSVTRGTNVTSADIPDGSWTFMIKAVDTSGNYSATAATSSATIVSDYDVITTIEESPDWSGTLTGFIKLFNGSIMPNGTALMSTFIDWSDFDNSVPDPVANAYYEIATPIDLGFDASARFFSLIESKLHPLAISGEADPHYEIDYKLDAGNYIGWQSWSIGSLTARYVKVQLHNESSVGIPIISGMANTLDAVERSERGESVVIGASGTTITFATQFNLPPFIEVGIQGTAALYPTRELITGTSFKVHVFNSAGTEVGGTIDWKATGV